jgi:hypothetical protein
MVEHTGKDIVIEDLSDSLPRRGKWAARSSAIRSGTGHHTGGSVRAEGRDAVIATARFSMTRDDPETPELEGRSWPAIPYTFFLAFRPAIANGRIVVYRCLKDEECGNQAGWWNAESFGFVFQGGLPGWKPSLEQKAAWAGLRPYLLDRYSLTDFELHGHTWRGKPACPGREIVGWLLADREEHPEHIATEAALREALAMALDRSGLTNPLADPHGWELRRAIAAFQKTRRIRDRSGAWHPALSIDGNFGPATESELRRALRELGGHR